MTALAVNVLDNRMNEENMLNNLIQTARHWVSKLCGPILKASLLTMACLLSPISHAQQKPFFVAFALFGPHPALQSQVDGFKDRMTKSGYVEGKNIRYVQQDVAFNPALISQLLNVIEAMGPDMIVTMNTPVAQAAKTVIKNKNIPFLFSGLGDPVLAKLVPSRTQGGEQMTGTSNKNDYVATFKFMGRLIPTLKTIGMPFNPGDDGDVSAVETAEAAAKQLGYQIRKVAVDSSSDIGPRVQSLRGSDAIFLIPSNLLQPAVPAVAAAANQISVPLVTVNSQTVKQRVALASFGVDWERIGGKTADMAIEIMGGKRTSQIPVYWPVATDHIASFNAELLKKSNLQVPAEFKDCKCVFE
ncbi:MAG: ABC transporter substrate-binding protein [Betaproteobacteria bacterium]|nr:ABC transporter substrate-binding protein [Betaproteobacteria bacterium]